MFNNIKQTKMKEPKFTLQDYKRLYALVGQEKLHLIERLFGEDDDALRKIIDQELDELDKLSEKILDVFR